jgi:hypoxanthine phosphoribosyltransferase
MPVPATDRALHPFAPADDGSILCRGERFVPYLSRDQLQARIAEMGAEISRDYAGKQPILIGVLNGAFVFIADLMRTLTIDCEVDFLKLSSYGAAKVSSGQVRELKRVDADIEGRHVIVVEDIVDTGQSMRYMLDGLAENNPASVRVATLLDKTEARQVEVPLDYVGFQIPNLFVLGYGLDYGQLARNLADLYILDPDGDAP